MSDFGICLICPIPDFFRPAEIRGSGSFLPEPSNNVDGKFAGDWRIREPGWGYVA